MVAVQKITHRALKEIYLAIGLKDHFAVQDFLHKTDPVDIEAAAKVLGI